MKMNTSIEELLHIIDDDDEESVLLENILTQYSKTVRTNADRKADKNKKRKRRVTKRDREEGHRRIYNDYLSTCPKYGESQFRRRFRMSSKLFRFIMKEVGETDIYFSDRMDAIGRRGVSPLQKIVAALRMLCYGEGADRQDEYIQIGQTTARQSCIHFCKAIVMRFGKEYLREPTEEDIRKILQVNTIRGFPGMIGKYNVCLDVVRVDIAI